MRNSKQTHGLRALLAAALFATIAPDAGAAPPQSGQRAPVNAGTASGRELRAPAEREDLSFVVFGDRTGGDAAGLRFLAQGVQTANRLGAHFVMTVGDLVNGYNEPPEWLAQAREYQRFMAKLEAPWYPVAGNHDVYGPQQRPGGNLALYREHFAPLYYSFDYRWIHVVCLFSDESLSFSNPPLDQNMSPEQLEWLKQDLAGTKAKQVFLFLHHPRWIYPGTNWPEVHEVLKQDGRVSAVFGGHIHTYRDEGESDGIRYIALAATGAGTGWMSESAQIQHIVNVNVERERFTVAVLPLGHVYGGDMVLGEEVVAMDRLRKGEWHSLAGSVVLGSERRESSLRLEVQNPTDRTLAWEAKLDSPPGWVLRAERSRGELKPGGEAAFTVFVESPPFESERPAVPYQVSLRYPLKSGLLQPVWVNGTLPIGLDEELTAVERRAPDRVLVCDGKSSLRVPLRERFEALTLECWVNAPPARSWSGLIAKTQSSGFSLNWDQRFPTGNVRVPGVKGYLSVHPEPFDAFERWVHVAFCWDGETSRFFVDGKLREEKAAKGPLQDNALPLFIGSDTNGRGGPEGFFTGRVDEVRVSRVSRYQRNFRPKQRHEPDEDTVLLLHFDRGLDGVFVDSSGNHHHAWPVGSPRLEDK